MPSSITATTPRLLDQVREIIRIKHYSIRTEQAYLQWIKRFILFHGKRHPRELGAEEVTAFLSDLAVRGKVSASTQNQALNAILFLYRETLKIELPWLDGVQRAKRPQRLGAVWSVRSMRADAKRCFARDVGDWRRFAIQYFVATHGNSDAGLNG